MNIPFEGIATFLLFIVGVPAFVLQSITPEERRVVLARPFWRDTLLFLGAAVVLVFLALVFRNEIAQLVGQGWIWGFLYFLLFLVVAGDAIYIPNHYGRREQIIKGLGKLASQPLKKQGRFDEHGLSALVGLGKQCESGEEQELVLLALDKLVEQACSCENYRPGMLETVIDEVVAMLISRPRPEDFQSFKTAVGLLRRIVTSNCTPGGNENLVDHQRAVRALSVLGQAVLSQVGYSIGIDYILMGYEEALNLALLNHPDLLTDVSQALFETGAVAIDSSHYLFAVAALRKLLLVFENTSPVPAEARVDTLGLLAHFWTANDNTSPSSRLFAEKCLERLGWEGAALQTALEQARQHCLFTMEFETADKIMIMAKDLQV
jgi:Ca2+/Na+ antiporter